MNRMRGMGVLGLAVLLIPLWTAKAQEAGRKPVMDPEADAVLRQMSDRLKTIPACVFRVADTIDDVQANGRKLQFAHVRELTAVRPNKLRVDVTGDLTNRTVWKDGKTITVFDKDKMVYAQLHDPGTIDQAIDMLQTKYNMSMPAADLLSQDAYKIMTANCDSVEYVGLGYVNEEKCHHLAFTGSDIDWQLWITAGKTAAPRKMVITYKRLPGEPQYSMQLLKVEDASKIESATFKADVPKDAQKIKFQPPAKPE